MLTVYSTQSCAFCPMVKKYLSLKNLAYEEVDVTNDPEKRAELLNATGRMTVPVTTDGETYVVGYQPNELSKFAG